MQTPYQNVWDTTKSVLREKCIALNTYIKKEERSEISNIICHLRKLEKEEVYLKSGTSMVRGPKLAA